MIDKNKLTPKQLKHIEMVEAYEAIDFDILFDNPFKRGSKEHDESWQRVVNKEHKFYSTAQNRCNDIASAARKAGELRLETMFRATAKKYKSMLQFMKYTFKVGIGNK